MSWRNAREYGLSQGLGAKCLNAVLEETYNDTEIPIQCVQEVNYIVKQCYLMNGFPIYNTKCSLEQHEGKYRWKVMLDIDTSG